MTIIKMRILLKTKNANLILSILLLLLLNNVKDFFVTSFVITPTTTTTTTSSSMTPPITSIVSSSISLSSRKLYVTRTSKGGSDNIENDDEDTAKIRSSFKSMIDQQQRQQAPAPASYVQWKSPDDNNDDDDNNNDNGQWEMLTGVTTFRHPKSGITIELHAQLHYGDTSYYNFYNTPEFNRNNNTKILYELLLDETLLVPTTPTTTNKNNGRIIKKSIPISASYNDQMMAKQYGWICQVDGIQYSINTEKYHNWIHADWTRQELLVNQQKQQYDFKQGKRSTTSITSSSSSTVWQRPGAVVGAAAEAATALLLGPPVILQQQQQTVTNNEGGSVLLRRRQRRIFTNLFVQGDSFAIFLRWALWLTVPCPELSILLLDSSSMWLEGTNSNKNKNNKSPTTPSAFFSALSPMTIPMIQTLVSGKIQDFRKLLFGQVIVTTNSVISTTAENNNNINSDWNLIVTQRNNRALEVLQNEINNSKTSNSKNQKQDDDSQTNNNQYVLLYGCSHCPDLHKKLIKLGYQPINTSWRTAWSIPKPKQQQQQLNLLVPLALLLSTYLTIGAFDWIGTIQNMARHVSESSTSDDIAGGAFLYLLRHVLIYVGLSRFLFDWKTTTSTTDK